MEKDDKDWLQRKQQAEQDYHRLGSTAPLPKDGIVSGPITPAFDDDKKARSALRGREKSKQEKMLQIIKGNIAEISTKFLELKMQGAGSDSGSSDPDLGVESIGSELKSLKDTLKDLLNSGVTENEAFSILNNLLDQSMKLKSRAEHELLEHNNEEYIEGEIKEIQAYLKELEENAQEDEAEELLEAQEEAEEAEEARELLEKLEKLENKESENQETEITDKAQSKENKEDWEEESQEEAQAQPKQEEKMSNKSSIQDSTRDTQNKTNTSKPVPEPETPTRKKPRI